jgi:soluble lytic murein transglycosylase-like protein
MEPRPSCPLKLRALGMASLALLSALGVVLPPSTAGADIYSFTDEDGVIHFSNRPQSDSRFRVYLQSSPGSSPKRVSGQGGTSVAPAKSADPSGARYTRYDAWIREASSLYQIPEELVRAVIKVESDYNPRVSSRTGAQGLMQLMPATGQRMQVRDAFDPRENIFGGVRYLRILANTFNGDLELTVAAYNAGEGAVARHKGIPPYAETQGYVVRVLTYYRRYRATSDVAAASRGY